MNLCFGANPARIRPVRLFVDFLTEKTSNHYGRDYAHLHCQKQAADLLPIQGGAGVGEPCSLYIDGKQPKAEQRELERGEGSKISRVC